MTNLAACLGEGKGTWKEVLQLAEKGPWEKVFLFGPTFVKQKYTPSKQNIVFVDLQENKTMAELVDVVKKTLSGSRGDVALNLSSGTGREHMALLAGALKAGCGIRLVTYGEKGMEELGF